MLESSQQTLLDAVIADPDDIAARLRYAAYLDRRGDPCGEFIRLHTLACRRSLSVKQVIHGVHPAGGFYVTGLEMDPVAIRCAELFPEVVQRNSFLWLQWPLIQEFRHWHNGFLNRLVCQLDFWNERHLQVLNAMPVTQLTLLGCRSAAEIERVAWLETTESLSQVIFIGVSLLPGQIHLPKVATRFSFAPELPDDWRW